ncbi:SAM-dependent methyltransferase [Methanomicrobium sp. W14]|nr:SAM-dependent methyltransferase [Methanomicrobium sp. W14]
MTEENPNAKLLDCGCSNGLFSKEIADHIKTVNIYGVDFQSRATKCHKYSPVDVCNCNLNQKMPFKDESFDVVHANQVIEHLTETDVFLEEIYRVLKPGGYAVLSTPNIGSFHNIVSLIFGYQPFSAHISNKVIVGNPMDPKHDMIHASPGEIHMRIFSYKGLTELMEYNGFTIEKICGAGYYPFPGILGKFLSKIDPRHAVYLIIKIRK